MQLSDQEYFFKPAEAELKMAQTSRNPSAVRAHYTLAGHYLDRAYGGHQHRLASADEIRSHLPISPLMQ